MKTPAHALRRKLTRQALALSVPVLACVVAPAAFAGAFSHTDAGPYEYTDTANWGGGVIGNNWTSSLTADQTITFASDYSAVDNDGGGSGVAGLSIANTGTFNHTFIGSGGNRTLTLGGGISLGSSTTNTNTVTLGSLVVGQQLNVDLGASTRTVATGTNRTLEILNVVSGTGGILKNGAGTMKLSNDANTFSGNVSIGGGSPSQFGGVLEVTSIADIGSASSIGTGNRITFGGANGAATLRYVGAGDSTSNRIFTVGGQGAIIESSGTGALNFTSTTAVDVTPSSSARSITFTGSNAGENTFTAAINNQGTTGFLSVNKQGTGRWVLAGNNGYTGDTTIDAGTLELGATNRIADSSNLVLNGGTFATGGFGETLGTLDVNGNAFIDFGSGDSDLVFSGSSGVTWGESISLSLVNFTEGVDSIRFGTTAFGLTEVQLGKITINGLAATIGADGYLAISAIPEPSAFAAVAGLGGLLLAGARRRRLAA